MNFTVEPFGGQDSSDFASGNADLDVWLRSHARTATGHGTRTYVLIDDAGAVVGYFAVAPHLVSRESVPARLGRGAPEQIPAILLAKLALDERIQGQGIGSELLVHALSTIVSAARRASGRVVIVDAIDESARTFYEHQDFIRLPAQPQRLVMKLSTAAKALGLPWP